MTDLNAELARMAMLSPRLAAEAARRDQEERWTRGERVPAERYLDALPQVAASPEDALVVIYGEVLLRGAGATPDQDRYRSRYPHLAEQLAALADVHGALIVEGDATPEDGSGAQPLNLSSRHVPSTTPDARHPRPPLPSGAPAVPGYTVVRRVGQGAMGAVWEARHLALNRTVALKVIRSAELAGPDEVLRFLSEAEALAAVEHPNVVRVYDVGRDGSQPYMALEYVAGGSLADRLRGGPLAPAEAARLLEQLARGVQAAHERGIIHRDLKPGNVLLEFSRGPQASAAAALPAGPRLYDAVAKVTDFGLARRVEAGTGLTQTGVVMGTPSYMAPEQAKGDSKRVGPAADVYALGAVLYECLTGRPPFVGPAVVDVLMQVVADEPVALRALAPKTPRDLETICHKCLHKDPARRYWSAAELAEDLRRFRDGEPILARPVGSIERAWKWARRRPALAGVLAVSAVGMSLAFGAVKSEQLVTAKQRDLAEENLERALTAEAVAKANLEEAQKAVDDCYGIAVEDPIFHDTGMQGVRKLLLEKTLPFYEGFTKRTPEDPGLAKQHARYLSRVGLITMTIGRNDDARKSLEAATAVCRRLADAHPEVSHYRLDLGQSYNNLGFVSEKIGAFPEAGKYFLEGQRILRELVKTDPENRHLSELAEICRSLGRLQHRTGQSSAAWRSFQEAIDLSGKLVEAHPATLLYRERLADCHNALAVLLGDQLKAGEAVRHLEEALKLYQGLAQARPDNTTFQNELARGHLNLAITQRRVGNMEAALANYQRARDIRQRLHDRYPEVKDFQRGLAHAWHGLGTLQNELGKHQEALASFRHTRDNYLALTQSNPEVTDYQVSLASGYQGMGLQQGLLGQSDEAIESYRQARKILLAVAQAYPQVPDFQHALAETCNGLGVLLKNQDRLPEALECYTQARDAESCLSKLHPEVARYRSILARSCNNLGSLQRHLGKLDDAIRSQEQARDLYQELVQNNPGVMVDQTGLASTFNSLANLQAAVGRRPEAIASYQQARDLLRTIRKSQKRLASHDDLLAIICTNLGFELTEAGRQAESLASLEEALAIRRQMAQAQPAVNRYQAYLGRSLTALGVAQGSAGKHPEAVQSLNEAVTLLRAARQREPKLRNHRLFLRDAYRARAEALGRMKRHREAVSDWDEVLRLEDPASPDRSTWRAQRALPLARDGDYRRAMAEVEAILQSGNPTNIALFNLASAASVSALAARRDPALPLPEREGRAERWDRLAVGLLRRAGEAGLFGQAKARAALKTVSDLDPLREREDFQRWLAEIDRASQR